MTPRVVLFNPPNAANPKTILPLSVLSVAATLDGTAEWTVVDGNVERDPEQALERALMVSGTDVLGITVMPGPQLRFATGLSQRLKARHPALQIVWGGYFPTQHWDVAVRAPYVDWVVRGHGESVFRDFLLMRSRGEDPRSLPGLAFKGDDGLPRSNGVAAVPHPDRLPRMPYHRIDLNRYVRKTVLGVRTLSHHSSYGCPFSCNFCAVVNMVGGRWKAESAERAASVVRYYVDRAGIDALELFDNNFFVHEARCREFAGRIADLGVAWWGEGRIDTLLRFDPSTWREMRRSGLKMIFMGAESGSDETLRRMDKGGTMSVDRTLEIAARMKEYGIVPEFSFVLGNPPDPEGDVASSIALIRQLKRINPAAEIIMYMYTPVPLAGELFEQAKAEGFSFPETLEGWSDPSWEEFSLRRSASMPWLNDRLRRQVRDFERVLNAYYPTSTNPRLRGVRRSILRAAGAWRWWTGRTEYPLELRALQRVFAYQRPETTGF